MSPATAAGPRPMGRTTEAPPVEIAGDVATIECRSVYYRAVNEAVRAAVDGGATTVRLLNVNGQRYIGTGLRKREGNGTPNTPARSGHQRPAPLQVEKCFVHSHVSKASHCRLVFKIAARNWGNFALPKSSGQPISETAAKTSPFPRKIGAEAV